MHTYQKMDCTCMRKLSVEEVEFLSGPRLLPNLMLPTRGSFPLHYQVLSDPEPDYTALNVTSRPIRTVNKSVNYADQCVDEDEGDEYLPPDESELQDKNYPPKPSSESEDNVPSK